MKGAIKRRARSAYQNRILRFFVSGGIAAVVNLGLLYLLVAKAGLHYLAATTIAFIGSFCASFALQKFFTFSERSLQGSRRQLLGYFALAVLNLGANALLMLFLVSVLHAGYLAAQFVVTAAIALYSYFLYRNFIFK